MNPIPTSRAMKTHRYAEYGPTSAILPGPIGPDAPRDRTRQPSVMMMVAATAASRDSRSSSSMSSRRRCQAAPTATSVMTMGR